MATAIGDEFSASLTYDVFEPNKAVKLSPLAVLRSRGQICDATRSAARTLHILEILAAARKPLRAVEIASPLDLSPSTASQLLKTLVDAAYLIFNPLSKRYTISPRVATLGLSIAGDYFGSSTRALMESVMHLGPRTTNLSTSQGDYMQLLDIISHDPAGQHESLSPHPHVGYRIPLFGSCIGAAWLSTQPEKDLYAYAQLCRRELRDRLGDIGRIVERIRETRRRGYAFGGLTPDNETIRGVAVPLPPTRSGVVLVLGVSGLSRDMEQSRDDIGARLRDAVKRFASTPAPRIEAQSLDG